MALPFAPAGLTNLSAARLVGAAVSDVVKIDRERGMVLVKGRNPREEEIQKMPYVFKTPEGASFDREIRRLRARREAARRRAIQRMEMDTARTKGVRNFTRGRTCETDGCETEAHAIDPLVKRAKVMRCKKCCARAWRVTQSSDFEKARERFRAKYG